MVHSRSFCLCVRFTGVHQHGLCADLFFKAQKDFPLIVEPPVHIPSALIIAFG